MADIDTAYRNLTKLALGLKNERDALAARNAKLEAALRNMVGYCRQCNGDALTRIFGEVKPCPICREARALLEADNDGR